MAYAAIPAKINPLPIVRTGIRDFRVHCCSFCVARTRDRDVRRRNAPRPASGLANNRNDANLCESAHQRDNRGPFVGNLPSLRASVSASRTLHIPERAESKATCLPSGDNWRDLATWRCICTPRPSDQQVPAPTIHMPDRAVKGQLRSSLWKAPAHIPKSPVKSTLQ